MRRLIRPALFLIARLGLFLAATAWIATQSWTLFVRQPLLDDSADVFLVSRGYSLHYARNVISRGEIRFGPREDVGHFLQHFELTDALGEDESLLCDIPGLMVASFHPKQFAVSIHHWLVFSIFVSLYGALKWIYREPQTDKADE